MSAPAPTKDATRKRPRQPDGTIRRATGRHKGLWTARKRYVDSSGVRREKKRLAPSQREAKEALEAIRAEIADELRRGRPADATAVTFRDLADFYEREYVRPPVYLGDRKVSGLRSHTRVGYHLAVLRAHFGAQRLCGLSYDDLRRYKERRLRERTKHDGERSVSAVNNELRILRRALNIGVRKGWLSENPFLRGDALISAADEVKRERILTREEEASLLAVCVGGRAHLRPLVVCALDTALRRNEQLTLTWEDVDLESRTIRVRARNSKRGTARTVPVTARLLAELTALRRTAERAPRFKESERVFRIKDFREAWTGARTKAGLAGVRWHDLRHTAITWMLEAGVSAAKVMKISGHTQWTTFLRYVNTNEETAREAGKLLDAHHAATRPKTRPHAVPLRRGRS
jgi:integrase